MQNRALIDAGVGRRTVADIVDLLVMSPVLFLVFRAFGHATTTVTPTGTMYNYSIGLPGLLLSPLVIVAYYTVLEGLLGGTVGKLVTGSSSARTRHRSTSARRSRGT